jgi:hypothetical protein
VHNILQSATHAVYELTGTQYSLHYYVIRLSIVVVKGEGEAITPRLRLTLASKPPFADDSVSSINEDTRSQSVHVQDDAQVIMASNVEFVSKSNTLFALQSQHILRTPPNSVPTEDSEMPAADTSQFLESVDFEIPPTIATSVLCILGGIYLLISISTVITLVKYSFH